VSQPFTFNQTASGEPPDPARILALDLGERRIGLALSDPLGLTAQGLPTLERTTIRQDLDRLASLAAEKGISAFLIGLPLHLSGREGAQAEWARDFARRLEAHTGLPALLWDERLTSVEANRLLRQSGISSRKRARAVDRLSAVLLLESYLERLAIQRQENGHPA